MAGGESAIAGNYTCRAAEQRSLHTLALGGVTADYSAKWSPPPALLCVRTNITILIITSTPKLNQKEIEGSA